MEFIEGLLLGLNVAATVWAITTLILHLEDTNKNLRLLSRIIFYFLTIATVVTAVYQTGVLGITIDNEPVIAKYGFAAIYLLIAIIWLIILSLYTIILNLIVDE